MNKDLYSFIRELPVIDTHEHLPSEQEFNSMTDIDFFDLLTPYVVDVIDSAAIDPVVWQRVSDKREPLSLRWELFEPWYALIKHTTYMQAVFESCAYHFGIDRLDAETVEVVTKRMRKENTPGLYDRLWKKMNIEEVHTYHLFNTADQFHSTPVSYIPTVSQFCPLNLGDIERIASDGGCTVQSFEDFETMMDNCYRQYSELPVKAYKFGNGYARVLDIGPCDRVAAASIFSQMLGGKSFSWEEVKPLDDYIVHYWVEKAKEQDIPIVFHVALHAWNRNDPRFCHAEVLTDLVRTYPEVQFVILHSGIPFTKEALLLCRYYPNVHLNMTWMHIISRRLSKEAMTDYLEFLPLNKITAFGGDYGNPFLIAGHLNIARENVAQVLSESIQQGVCTLEEAKGIARMWFYENPKRLFAKC